jgi:hypothetical protein
VLGNEVEVSVSMQQNTPIPERHACDYQVGRLHHQSSDPQLQTEAGGLLPRRLSGWQLMKAA